MPDSESARHRIAAKCDPVRPPRSEMASSSAESDEDRGSAAGGKRRRKAACSASAPSGEEPSRRAFQKLWTDADEIAVLRGYFEFTERRGTAGREQQLDTGAFYDEIRGRLGLDFTRSQLAEKLRRLRRKYRSVAGRVAASEGGFVFRSPHEKAAFDIAGKIWAPPALKPQSCDLDGLEAVKGGALDATEPHSEPRPRRRLKKGTEEEAVAAPPAMPPTTEMVEQTLRSCFSPLFSQIIRLTGIGHGELPPGHLPLSSAAATALAAAAADGEQWKKQQIMELEVYLKRVELVHEHIKTKLEELKSSGSS